MPQSKARILLADDDFGYRFPLKNQLVRRGYKVIDVPDVAGVERHHREADVLVLDVRLPSGDMEGIAVAARLRSQEPKDEWKPMIFISVLRQDECSASLGSFPGPHHWLVKPFEVDCLLRCIENSLKPNRGHDG